MKPKVYLAGSVFETKYRQYCHDIYGTRIDFLDPIKENGVIIHPEVEVILKRPERKEIVEKDKSLIFQSDYVVACINRLSFGTIMECMLAFDNNIKLYLITNQSTKYERDVWLGYHIDEYFYDIDKCMNVILKEWYN